MPTVACPPEQRVVLRNVSWETYERLLEDHLDRSAPRFTYDQGVLEIMSPSAEHEWYNRLISDLVKLLARESRIDVLDLGSTTFKRAPAKQGFEPDSCFYVTHIREVRGKDRLDMAIDPSPDLVVEVMVTHPSLSKFSLYAELGIPEVWTYDGSRLAMYELRGREYIEIPSSRVLRGLKAQQLGEFLELGKTLDSLAWPEEVLLRFRRSG
jgi:Uma2 family endonuclease